MAFTAECSLLMLNIPWSSLKPNAMYILPHQRASFQTPDTSNYRHRPPIAHNSMRVYGHHIYHLHGESEHLPFAAKQSTAPLPHRHRVVLTADGPTTQHPSKPGAANSAAADSASMVIVRLQTRTVRNKYATGWDAPTNWLSNTSTTCTTVCKTS